MQNSIVERLSRMGREFDVQGSYRDLGYDSEKEPGVDFIVIGARHQHSLMQPQLDLRDRLIAELLKQRDRWILQRDADWSTLTTILRNQEDSALLAIIDSFEKEGV